MLQLSAADRASLTPRYEILEEVGRGGMGAVYRARHRMLDRAVAVKVCLPGAEAGRFQREAQLLARLRSNHIVTVHDFDRLSDGRMLLVMDWVQGSDLCNLGHR